MEGFVVAGHVIFQPQWWEVVAVVARVVMGVMVWWGSSGVVGERPTFVVGAVVQVT